jgi:hypothetical protein
MDEMAAQKQNVQILRDAIVLLIAKMFMNGLNFIILPRKLRNRYIAWFLLITFRFTAISWSVYFIFYQMFGQITILDHKSIKLGNQSFNLFINLLIKFVYSLIIFHVAFLIFILINLIAIAFIAACLLCTK